MLIVLGTLNLVVTPSASPMLTYVVCKASDRRFHNIAYPRLCDQCIRFSAELIVVEDPVSIFRAYEQGRRIASHDIIVYLHDDAVLLDPDTTPKIVRIFLNNPRLGLMGVLGSAESNFLPWWTNINSLGHCFYPRFSRLASRPLVAGCSYVYSNNTRNIRTTTFPISTPSIKTWEALPNSSKWQQTSAAGLIDGVLMAERRNGIPWDTTAYTGWHAYDADRSLQILAAGYTVAVCDLLVHHRAEQHDRAWLNNHSDNIKVACDKWGLTQSSMAIRWINRSISRRITNCG